MQLTNPSLSFALKAKILERQWERLGFVSIRHKKRLKTAGQIVVSLNPQFPQILEWLCQLSKIGQKNT